MTKPAVQMADAFQYVAVEDRSDPRPTQDGHMVVRIGQVLQEGRVWATTWECVVCGTGYTPGFKDRLSNDPPDRLRTDCQTALTNSVLGS